MLPFTREEFVAVFVAYNTAVWPAQVLAYLLGLLMVALIIWPSAQRSRVVAAGLSAMWLWTGVAYHGRHFTAISAAAWGFGALFLVQGLLFIETGVLRGRLAFGPRKEHKGWTGWLGWAGLDRLGDGGIFKHRLSAAGPVVHARLPGDADVRHHAIPGHDLHTRAVPPDHRADTAPPVVIPVAWSLIGGQAAFQLGMTQDWLLLFSGATVIALLWRDAVRRRVKPHEAPVGDIHA